MVLVRSSKNLRCLFLFLLSFLLASCSLQYRHQVVKPGSPENWQSGMGGFIRYNGYNNVAGDMEVAIADYKKTGSPIQIKMVGVIHIADRDYYEALQKILDASDLVLYEGVRMGGNPGDVDPSSKAMYGALGEILGLSGQLECIQYNRKHWKQCDWITDAQGTQRVQSPAQVKQMFALAKSIAPLKKELAAYVPVLKMEHYLKHSYALNLSKSQDIDFKSMIKSIEQWQRMIKQFSQMFPSPYWKQLDDTLSRMKKSFAQFAEILIVKRNAYVMEKLEEEIKNLGSQTKDYTISVFYGAGHLKDFEARLAKIGYERTKMEWHVAWKIDSWGKTVPAKVIPIKPEVTKPEVTKPEVTKPEVTKPEVTKPEVTKPEVTKPETNPNGTKTISPAETLFEAYMKAPWGQKRWDMEKEIKKLGDSLIPMLVEKLKAKEESVKGTAIDLLGVIREKPEVVVPELLKVLQNDPSAYMRQKTAIVLGYFKHTDPKVISAMLEVFKTDKNSTVKNNMAFTLAKVGPTILPELEKLMDHSDPYVRAYSAMALTQIWPRKNMDSALPYLFKNLKDSDEFVRRCTIQALAIYGKKAAPAVPDLVKALGEAKDVYERSTIVQVLGEIGSDAEPAVPQIMKFLKDSNNSLQRNTIVALGKIGKKGKEVVPLLIEILKTTKDTWTAQYTIEALGKFKEEAAPAVPEMAKYLGHKDTWLEIRAIQALGNIGSGAKEAIPALEEVVKKGKYSKWEAQTALKKIRGEK